MGNLYENENKFCKISKYLINGYNKKDINIYSKIFS